MQSSQQEEKGVYDDDDELYQQFKHLQQDWDSFKESNPRCVQVQQGSSDVKSTADVLQLFDISPRNLLSSLQVQHYKQSPIMEGEWNVRNNDLAVMEILRERRMAIQSGKLRRRRLFEALESAGQMGLRGKDGSSSSVLNQGSEVRSICSFSSTDDEEEDGGVGDGYDGDCCYTSSGTSTVSVEKMEKEKGVVMDSVEEKSVVGDGSCSDGGCNVVCGDGGLNLKVLVGWLTFASIIVLFLFGWFLLRSSDEHVEENGEAMFLT